MDTLYVHKVFDAITNISTLKEPRNCGAAKPHWGYCSRRSCNMQQHRHFAGGWQEIRTSKIVTSTHRARMAPHAARQAYGATASDTRTTPAAGTSATAAAIVSWKHCSFSGFIAADAAIACGKNWKLSLHLVPPFHGLCCAAYRPPVDLRQLVFPPATYEKWIGRSKARAFRKDCGQLWAGCGTAHRFGERREKSFDLFASLNGENGTDFSSESNKGNSDTNGLLTKAQPIGPPSSCRGRSSVLHPSNHHTKFTCCTHCLRFS